MATDKSGGFGSIPGDVFDKIVTYFSDPKLSAAELPKSVPILAELARAEHAAANPTKDAYVVAVALKCAQLEQSINYLKDEPSTAPDRSKHLAGVEAVLIALRGLYA